MQSRRALVITSISAPNDVLRTYARECTDRGIDFIVIGDVSSPSVFDLPGCDFWGIERQWGLDSALAPLAPERSYARKNLGYLIAMQRGVGVIVETDDDNLPLEGFWREHSPETEARVAEGEGWLNVYRYFTGSFIWPRGFPLEFARQPVKPRESFLPRRAHSPIQQGLADGNPDVDAVYRLLLPLPFSFDAGEPVALGRDTCCPFNSQNTVWFREAFPLMYLPATCSFRMTDIWRSLIAQRICHENGWHLLFHEATVWQERNEHDLLKDFGDEIPGYLGNARLWSILSGIRVEPGVDRIPANLRRIYTALVEHRYFEELELRLLEGWLADLNRLGR